MDEMPVENMVSEIRKYITEYLPLSQMSDEELEEKIEEIVAEKTNSTYYPIEKKLDIVHKVYSSIRGLGLLDTIMNDENITEVMINGPDNIFIEKNGKLTKMNQKFESQRRIEDIIQRIVGQAGREVNQANPICDTRLQDGSRVSVVLPPIALCGPTMTIRKFSKEPMTIEKLIEYGSITQEIAEKLELLVRAKYNIFVCGGTGSGKTTFLNALSNYIPKDENVSYNTQNNSNLNYSNNPYKKRYYYTSTGKPASAFDYLKFRIREFFSNILFIFLLILVFVFIINFFLSTNIFSLFIK